ncbi:MAG: efflux RND transporter periplasmic adaptor subunit [Sphingobacteriales bacterium]|nr:efflux RND transporter periplasmic adaptor subunit [Sphingobacteriales bacterium]
MNKNKLSLLAIAGSIIILASCGSKEDNGNKTIAQKKARLEKLNIEVAQLKEELAKLDTGNANDARIKLVATSPVAISDFKHYIDLRGRVDAENISYITPRGMGGQVKAIYVQEGQRVSKGQLLLKLDDAIQRQSVVAARQQLDGIKTQLNYAKNIYDRQKNLWDKGIGTEVQLISARTNVQSLEDQLKSSQEQVQVAVEQLNTSNVYSDVSGIADVVNVRVGELFSGMGQIKIVNNSNLKAVSNVPENYISRLQKGTPVVVEILDAGKKINTTVSLISQSIDPTQRGFMAEAKLPSDPMFKPNQSVVMRFLDYTANQAVVIPVNAIQSDEKNKYVYVMEKSADGKLVARKKIIIIGEVYGNEVEVKEGLKAGEQLITEGYQNLYEGQLISNSI